MDARGYLIALVASLAFCLVCAGQAVPVEVFEDPDLTLVIYTYPERPTGGEDITIFLELYNRGNTDFEEEVTATLRIEDNFASKEQMDISVPAGGYAKYSMVYSLPNAMSGRIRFQVVLAYTLGDRHMIITSEIKEIEIDPMGAAVNLKVSADKSPAANTDLVVLIGLLAGVICGAIVLVALVKRGKAPKKAAPAPQDTTGKELESLYTQKAETEERIKLAKVKFYKRKINEDSYKEIVKHNEETLIEIEAKIREIEKRLSALEKKASE